MKVFGVLLGMLLFLFGGYYGFTGCLSGIVLCTCCIVKIRKEGKFSIKVNVEVLSFVFITLFYGVAVLYSVDKGSAFLGFLKIAVIPLFIFFMQQYEATERENLLNIVPILGAIAVGIGMVVGITGIKKELFFLSGRFGGPFQYPNTMALFLLTGIVLWEIQKTKQNVKTWASVLLILLVGILMTGSRSVFLLTVLWLLISSWKRREVRIWYLTILGALIVFAGVYTIITLDFQNIGRFLTISGNSSTLLGRFLYWIDAVHMIIDYPFGTGYGGYESLQGLYQSGAYHVQYVHNDFLQYMLDVGVIPTIFLFVAIVKSFMDKHLDKRKKTVMFLIVIHSMFDFDLQFLIIMFLLILCMNIDQGKEFTWQFKKSLKVAAFGFGGIWLYFGIVQLFCYIGKYEIAYAMFPAYTEAAENILKTSDSIDEAEQIAQKLLITAPYSSVAHSTLALKALDIHDFETMQKEQKKAIGLAPYEAEGYEQYIRLLISELSYSFDYNMEEDYEKCREELLNVPQMMQKTIERTSALGWKIRDNPRIELSEEIQDYLQIFLIKNKGTVSSTD